MYHEHGDTPVLSDLLGAETQMENSDIPYEERELIQRAIRNTRPFSHPQPRWVMAKRVFGVGASVAAAICTRYGFDPDKDVDPFGCGCPRPGEGYQPVDSGKAAIPPGDE